MEPIIFSLFIGVAWAIYYISIYIYFKRSTVKTKNFDSLIVVHNNCHSCDAKYIYLFKVFYGRSRKKFFFLTTILLEFIDEKDKLFLSVKIPHRALFESQKEGFKEGDKNTHGKLLAFVLQTKVSLANAVYMRISHDCKIGELFVYEIRVIDLITKDTYNSMVQNWIRYLPTGTQPRAQIFLYNLSGRNMTDIKPSAHLKYPEIALFFIFGLHWILLHIQYGITSTEDWIFAQKYDSIQTMALTATISAVTAFLFTALVLTVYYYLIKRNYSELRGIGFIWIVRWAFIACIVVFSFVFGLIGAFRTEDTEMATEPPTVMPSDNPNQMSDTPWDATTLKWYALIISIVIFGLGYFTLMLCAYSCGCFKDPEEYDLRSADDKSYKSVRSVSKKTDVKTDSNQNIIPVNSTNDLQRKRSSVMAQPSKKSDNDFKSVP